MTTDGVQLLLSFVACGVAVPIIAIGEMRRFQFERRLVTWWQERRRPPQRKSDESLARIRCAPRARLGIDVYPANCPVTLDAPVERVCDVIQGRRAA